MKIEELDRMTGLTGGTEGKWQASASSLRYGQVAYGEPRLVKHKEGEYSDGDENHINGLESASWWMVIPQTETRR